MSAAKYELPKLAAEHIARHLIGAIFPLEWYILRDRRPVKVRDLNEWAEWAADQEYGLHVALNEIGDSHVSTVFLGFWHGMGGPPCLFETMIFGGAHDGYQQRSSTWKEAEQVHRSAIARVRGRLS